MMYRYGQGAYNGMQANGLSSWLHMGFKIIFFIVAIMAIIMLVRYLVNTYSSLKTNVALDELKLRFVKGEITEKEYLSKKELL